MSHAPGKNYLADASSPYLLQHADNPVLWYPWGDEALARAREEDKPILLSIGYSACHWCHVMAHESFEDEEIAAVMNALFVNIKVDREERPDLDKIYQLSHQLLTERPGGWPLTLFLAPDDLTAFFGGTYFPKEPRYNLPGFGQLLRQVSEYYRSHRDDVARQNRRMNQALSALFTRHDATTPLSTEIRSLFLEQAESSFDARRGGFGRAPKFPHVGVLACLLKFGRTVGARRALLFSLERMGKGGFNDQIGGGFCRYSVDDDWMIPHFEKMLYDNGGLLAIYARAAAEFDAPELRRVARATADWAMREMQSEAGGFFSSLDADSEGREGRFYVWDVKEVEEILPPDEFALARRHFGFDREPNFEGRHYPHVFVDIETLAKECSLTPAECRQMIDRSRARLHACRARRIRPGRDEKILTSWNALMIRGMALAAQTLDDAALTESASRALAFVRNELWRDGRLLATCKDGDAHIPAWLDDHAFLIDAILTLLQNRWDSADLQFAIDLAEILLTHFEDAEHGGFFFTADDHEAPCQRPKTWSDDAMPGGNGVAARALLELSALTGEPRYHAAAERTLKAGAVFMRESPMAHGALIEALDEYLDPGKLIVLRGKIELLDEWKARLRPHCDVKTRLYAIAEDEHDLPASLAEKRGAADVSAFVCQGQTCLPAIEDCQVLIDRLQGRVREPFD